MREKINKLAHGCIDDVSPVVSVQPASVEYELIPDHPVKLEIIIRSENDVIIKGLAYSDDERIRILNPTFGGSAVRLVIEAAIRNSDDGESFTGNIDLVTNGGEISVPYRFNRKDIADDHHISLLSTIEDFAGIAEENKEEALRIFLLPNFTDAPFMQDIRRLKLYKLFRSCPSHETALDQFLASCGCRLNNQCEESKEFCRPYKSYEVLPASENVSNASTYKRHFYEYSRTRLKYDIDSNHDPDMIDKMLMHLDAMTENKNASELAVLYKAEAEFLRGNTIEALSLMNSVSQSVRESRSEKVKEYFLLEYLEIIINHRDKASFLRLCRKFLEEQKITDLFIYIVKLDDELMSNDNQLRIFLTDVFNMGVRSPWLYFYYCMLLNDHPEYLYSPKAIDSHSLNFGRKYNIISSNITLAVVSASCTANIKADKRHVSAHRIYAEAIELDININGLYEYYLYSLPNDENYVISDKVLNHFRSGDRLDVNARTRLYYNVVKYKKKNSGIYKSYEDRILEFAVSQLKNQNINDYLITIYTGVLRPEIIGQDCAEQFLNLVNCYSIKTDNDRIKSVIVTYAQASEDQTAYAQHGNAITPIFYDTEIIIFQDVYGNRYFDVPYEKTALFTQNSLKNAAEKLVVNSRISRIKKSNDLIYKKNLSAEDVLHLENEVFEKDLNDVSKAIIIRKLISYYNVHAATGYNPDFLLRIDRNSLNNTERQELCNAYITCGCFKEAYKIICDFGHIGISDKNLRTLCSNLIQSNTVLDDELLLKLSELTVRSGCSDDTILDYLCKRYNGPTSNMYEILKRSIASHVDTHDMEERLIAQLIFINDNKLLDTVFEWYVARRKASETIIKAYFTVKSAAYFFEDDIIDSKIFEYIENAAVSIDSIEQVPVVYVLALTKYYSGFNNLSRSRIELSKKMVLYLLERKLYFNYLRRFSEYFELPEDFMIRKTVSIRAQRGKHIVFRSQILPSENSLLPEAADNAYLNVYFKSKVLFAGETWKYEAVEADEDSEMTIDTGEVSSDTDQLSSTDGKYSELDRLCDAFDKDSDKELLHRMREYLIKEEMVKNLFC